MSNLKNFLAVALLVFGGVFAASAQIDSGSALRFSVSHQFTVDNKTFSAGDYIITRISNAGTSDMLRMQSKDGKESILFSVMDKDHSEAAKDTSLVFTQVGDTYYLTEIRVAGDETGIVLDQTKAAEKAIAAVN